MLRIEIRTVVLGVVLALTGGCTAYEPRPLEAARIVSEVDRSRQGGEDGGARGPSTTAEQNVPPELTLARAERWMRAHGPDHRDAVARYRRTLARVGIPTPLPDPQLSIGPAYAFGNDVSRTDLVPFGSMSIRVPLSDRRAAQDAVNLATAERARIEGLARWRELDLELRRRWLRLHYAREIATARSELAEATARSTATTRRLVEAGSATALDVAIFRLEESRTRAAHLAARQQSASALADLASLVGVAPSRFGASARLEQPAPSDGLPAREALRETLIVQHPELARRRADYGLSDARLRLEVARQYPDLVVGPSVSGEAGDRRTLLGLSLGMRLPLFDGNRVAIADGEARRTEAEERFRNEANRALGNLDRALELARLARERETLLRDTVAREAEANLELARRSLAAGSGNALLLLEAERSRRALRIEVLQAELAAQEAWCALERAVGHPLRRFASEGNSSLAPVPPEFAPVAEALEASQMENAR